MTIRGLCLFCLGFLTAGLLQAQHPVKEKQVPTEILHDFGLRFHEAENIFWQKSAADQYGASFQLRGAQTEAVYEGANGRWIQTTEEMSFSGLPDSAKVVCAVKYPDYVVDRVSKISTRQMGILFELKAQKEQKRLVLTFDMHGKLVERSLEEMPEKEPAEEPAPSPKQIRNPFKKE